MSARQEAKQALLEKQQLLVELEWVWSRKVIQATEQLRQDQERRYKSEMDAQLELIGMLKRQVHTPTGTLDVSVGKINHDPSLSSGRRGLDMHTGGVDKVSLNDAHHNREACQSVRSTRPVQYTDLPPLSMFDGKVQDNGNAFDRWSRKLPRNAEIQQWTE